MNDDDCDLCGGDGCPECEGDGGQDGGHDDGDDCDDYQIDGVGFADPGGRSSLRAETPDNPRNLPCPSCGEPDRLTPIDVARGYQCDDCADGDEGGC